MRYTRTRSTSQNACGSCDDMLYIWTESRVHVHKLHEDNDDDKEMKKGTNENNMVVTYVKKISEKKVISDPTLKEFGGIQSDKKED